MENLRQFQWLIIAAAIVAAALILRHPKPAEPTVYKSDPRAIACIQSGGNWDSALVRCEH